MIGAYYQCYNKDKALNFVLYNYRKYYTDTNLVLVCDGGNNYKEQSEKYNCHYFYEEKIKTEKNLVFQDVKSVLVFFERLKKYINLIDEDFFIILEDDVYVMNKIDESSLIYDINGCNFNEFFNDQTNNFIRNYNSEKKERYFFGGCGGSIIKTTALKKIFEKTDSFEELVNLYCSINEKKRWASDQILSFIFLVNNLTIGQYYGFCETWYENYQHRLENNSIQVLHQYKKYY